MKDRAGQTEMESLCGAIEGLCELRVSIDPLSTSSGDIFLDGTFESAAYPRHLAHLKTAAFVRSVIENRVCSDDQEGNETMKVLLINGSPHPEGCTFTALKEIEEQLKKGEIETEIFQLGIGPIRGCTACGWCKNGGGRCVYDDDPVNRVLEIAEACDGFVFGSPVYYASAAGAMVALLDRCFYAGSRFFAFQPGAAIVSARRAGTSAALEVLNKYIVYNNMPMVPSRYWNMVHGSNAEQAKQDEEGMQIMRQLGRNMVWLMRALEHAELPELESQLYTNFIR